MKIYQMLGDKTDLVHINSEEAEFLLNCVDSAPDVKANFGLIKNVISVLTELKKGHVNDASKSTDTE